MKLHEHPTIKAVHATPAPSPAGDGPLDADWLRSLARSAGADDVGLVEIERSGLAGERQHLLDALPGTRLLLSFVCRMNREPVRSPARSVANLEFHHTGDQVDEVAREIVRALESRGIRALNPSMGFPMEMERFPGRLWVVEHKTVAQEAGLGRMGVHRNVIHPRFGNFVLLGTVLVAARASAYDHPLDYNPCLECKLCVAACPVGAIGADGDFNFSSCYTHNYREFMGGFTDWVETVADSGSRRDYRERVTPGESASMWQSLSYGANYKAAYCMAACPAGEDVIGPFLHDRGSFLERVVRPLQKKEEAVYVVPESDAEQHVKRRFPHKRVRHVRGSLYPTTIPGFFSGLPLVFQPGRAGDLAARYHFTFTSRPGPGASEPFEMTVAIESGKLTVERGHTGRADLRVRADGNTWLRYLAGKQGILRALITRKIKLRGRPSLLVRFGKCFA